MTMMVPCPDCNQNPNIKCYECYGTGWIPDPTTKVCCIWTLAERPEGIAPAAFSWWDCEGKRRYGIPIPRICDVCGNRISI